MKLEVLPHAAHLTMPDGEGILFGGFSEVHKILLARRLTFPGYLVFPDTLVRNCIPQINLEFLFYCHLFLKGNFDFASSMPKSLLTIAGSAEQCDRARELLRICFLGPSDSELHTKWRINKSVRLQLRREMDFFSLKGPGGKAFAIDDLVRFHDWKSGPLRVSGKSISRTGWDRFRVDGGTDESLDINLGALKGTQSPSWSVAQSSQIEEPCDFSIRILGASSGFDIAHPSTTYLLYLGHQRYLWDSSPFSNLMLEASGVSWRQIRGIVVSHVHDDHAVDLIRYVWYRPGEVIVYTTREIAESLIIKLSMLTGESIQVVTSGFQWVFVRPGTPVEIEGCRFDWHYGAHPIPSIGAMITRRPNETLVISGDSAFGAKLDEMTKKGVINSKRARHLSGLASTTGLAVMDAGEAIIHGAPSDFLDANEGRIVLAHRGALPEEYMSRFELASFGFTHVFSGCNSNHLDAGIMKQFLDSIGLTDPKWLVSALGECKELILAPDSRLEADAGSAIYVVSSGILDIFVNHVNSGALISGMVFTRPELSGLTVSNWDVVARTWTKVLVLSSSFASRVLSCAKPPTEVRGEGSIAGPDFSVPDANWRGWLLVSGISGWIEGPGRNSDWVRVLPGETYDLRSLSSNMALVCDGGIIRVSSRQPGSKPALAGPTAFSVSPSSRLPILPRSKSLTALEGFRMCQTEIGDFERYVFREEVQSGIMSLPGSAGGSDN